MKSSFRGGENCKYDIKLLARFFSAGMGLHIVFLPIRKKDEKAKALQEFFV